MTADTPTPAPQQGDAVREALVACRAELLSIHLRHGDRDNALAHSAALRAADLALDRPDPAGIGPGDAANTGDGRG